ncbi:DUF2268 domain-containing protein [Bacillus sp. FJAT-47783]|uniref:DUF2268 domain-containing protein n=1 Tax=Bacillus sp. FJAT-47783 TaxID=2922712 RepID=UPI001FAC3B64|nr:DUF2268 domain-containing protein [Bacillus sp. FJAT-47783]
MGVVNTNEWLKKDPNPLKACEKLTHYFQQISAEEIYDYLKDFGMYRSVRKTFLKEMERSHIWPKVKKRYERLKQKWEGPDVPVFIFPVDERNGLLTRDFQGRSGVSFPDKMFLFLSPRTSDLSLDAVITHEYHHICRLHKYSKREEEYTLLDTIILEGLAEHAVKEEIGEEAITHWMTKYSPTQLKRWWNMWVKDNQHVKRDHPKYVQLLFGKAFYPTMLGYALGYDIVETYHKQYPFSIEKSFTISSNKLIRYYEAQGD